MPDYKVTKKEKIGEYEVTYSVKIKDPENFLDDPEGAVANLLDNVLLRESSLKPEPVLTADQTADFVAQRVHPGDQIRSELAAEMPTF